MSIVFINVNKKHATLVQYHSKVSMGCEAEAERRYQEVCR